MKQKFDADVLVVGAGPVGMTLALDLGRRGVKTILIDAKTAPLKLPKMERSNPRTMEIYRRLGIVDRLRAAAYPADVAMDCFIATSLVAPPLVQQRYPSVNEARGAIARCHDGSLPREPYQLISQYTLEPILLDELRHCPAVEVRLGTSLLSFTQDTDGVTAQLSGEQPDLRVQYLAGCDGAGSLVRKTLGITLTGDGGLAQVSQVFFRSDNFYKKCTIGPGRHYSFVGKSDGGAGVGGVIAVQDDRRHFTMQTTSPEGTDFAAEIRRTVGAEIGVEILYTGQWTQHMMVATSFGAGRVFLAGDANHLFIPAGGLGMNTGIGDAINLGWKLEAMAKGFGGPELGRSYLAEREAVVRRNLAAVWHAVRGVMQWRAAATAALFEDGAGGDTARAEFAAFAEPLNRRVYEMHGTELGYRYASPVIAPEAGPPPPDDSFAFLPSTYPGRHLPHLWLADGTALYDRLGAGYTLLRLGGNRAGTQPLEYELQNLNVPLAVIDIDDPAARDICERNFLLLRPDMHVAWRGDAPPEHPRDLARLVSGHL
jgi:2-polyprenyl-6-methoxyphenol hydroxylase-like FAD-dependent oxidoreductase